jgi:hypothetical protein
MVNYKLKYLQGLSSPLEAKHLSAAWQKNFRAADICWEEKKALCLSADICREKKKHFATLPTFAEPPAKFLPGFVYVENVRYKAALIINH